MATRKKEHKVYGFQSVMAAFKKRPESIIRAYVTEERLKICGELLKYCAKEKKAYHVVKVAELTKITHADHHEGVALLCHDAEEPTEQVWLKSLATRSGPIAIVVCDGVENPHNLGSMVRSAAHFGVHSIVVSSALKSIPSATYRVAEGGCEHVDVRFTPSLKNLMLALKESGFVVIGTSSHASGSIYQFELPEKCVFLLGSESSGVSSETQKVLDFNIKIPGTEQVESLNVSVAAAVFMAEFCRQHCLNESNHALKIRV